MPTVPRTEPGEPDVPEILLLGPVRVRRAGQELPVGPPRRQAVLAVLAMSAGSVVPRATLIEAVWGDDAPDGAAASLHTYVWALRKLLGPDRLRRAGDGYLLALPRQACDALRWQDGLARAWRGSPAAESTDASTDDDAALLAAEDWRGEPLAGLPGRWAARTRERLWRLRSELLTLPAGAAAEDTARYLAPAQLPPSPRGFVGRAAEIADLTGRLTPGPDDTAPRVVLVHGPGGVGKSALAATVAHAVARRYPDGQLYADLRAHHPGYRLGAPDVLPAFLEALGARPADIPADSGRQSAMLRARLHGRRVLIVLDDVPDLDALRLLTALKPGSAVLVTSRLRLAGTPPAVPAEYLTVGPMNEADAVEVLRRHVGPPGAAVEGPVRARLARACGYWPLALRVAAEILHQHGGTSVEQFTDRLWNAGDVRLEGLRLDEDDESTAVGDVLSWSYRLLPPGARQLYRLIGVCPSVTFDQHVLAALLGVPVEGARDAARVLTFRHLLDPVEGRPGQYAVHDLVRVHARLLSRAEDAPEVRAAAVHRVLRWFACAISAARAADGMGTLASIGVGLDLEDVTEELGLGVPGAADEWYERNRADLVVACRAAAEAGAPASWEIALGMSAYLKRHVDDRRPYIVMHELAAEAARAAGAEGPRVSVLNNLSNAYELSGEVERALEVRRQMLVSAELDGDPSRIVFAAGAAAQGALLAGRPAEAETLAREALDRYAADEWPAMPAHEALAVVLLRRGDHDEGLRHADRAVALARASGLTGRIFSNAVDVARALLDLRPDRAVEVLRRTFADYEWRPTYELGTAQVLLARAALRTGDRALAQEAASAAVSSFAADDSAGTREARAAARLLADLEPAAGG